MAFRFARLVEVVMGLGTCCACSGNASLATPMPNSAGSTGSPISCSPGTRRCAGHEIERCDDTGSAEIMEQDCLSAQCRMQSNGPACDPTVCAANLAVCDGNTRTRCKLDGSGPLPGGVDCSATKQFCRGGECRDSRCDAYAKSCQDGDVYQCSADGSRLSVWDSCTDAERCDEGSVSCVARLCEADTLRCDGTRVLQCDALGGSWLPATTDCAAQGQVCLAGKCEDKTCTPSTTFCKDNDLYRCNSTGTSSTLAQTCTPGAEHCELTPAGLYAFCVSNVCTPGNEVCAGDAIKTCNPDGSLPADGIDCAEDEFCEDAVCKPRSCELGSFFCKENDVYSCDHSGPTLYERCDPGQACHALANLDPNVVSSFSSDLIRCAKVPCPGTTGCVLNQLGSCGPDGSTLSKVTTDCASSGQVCTSDDTCAASVSDTLGEGETVQPIAANEFVGSMLEVHSSRRLTELSVWLVFPAARDLRFRVYEQLGSQFIPLVDQGLTVASSAGLASSGPLSFDLLLEAGKRYALGVQVSGDCVGFTDSIPFAKEPSFATVLGGVSAHDEFGSFSVAGQFLPDRGVYMTVTTELPSAQGI